MSICFISCNNVDSNDPNAVLKSFFEQLAKKDIDGAAKLATKDSKSTLDMVKKGMDMAATMKDSLAQNDPMKEFKEVEYSKAKIEGDKAFITVTNKAKQQSPVEFILLKEDGRWKVDFSMATLMKMGQKELQKEGVNMGDSLQHLNPEDLKHSMEVADSLLKNMDPKQLEEIQKKLEK